MQPAVLSTSGSSRPVDYRGCLEQRTTTTNAAAAAAVDDVDADVDLSVRKMKTYQKHQKR